MRELTAGVVEEIKKRVGADLVERRAGRGREGRRLTLTMAAGAEPAPVRRADAAVLAALDQAAKAVIIVTDERDGGDRVGRGVLPLCAEELDRLGRRGLAARLRRPRSSSRSRSASAPVAYRHRARHLAAARARRASRSCEPWRSSSAGADGCSSPGRRCASRSTSGTRRWPRSNSAPACSSCRSRSAPRIRRCISLRIAAFGPYTATHRITALE